MPQTSDAEDHLRIIRSLMEKATIYRAISSQAALIGGLLAVVAGWLLAGRNDPFVNGLASSHVYSTNALILGFQLKWFVVLVLSGAVNFYFLYRDALRRQEAFVSPGMRLALRAMAPALLCGAAVTSLWPRDGLPQMWMIFYGLALLSTVHFAPRSLAGLGWAFLLTGLGLMVLDGEVLLGLKPRPLMPGPEGASQPAWTYTDSLMACTFGAYHLIYAACTARRAPSREVLVSA